MNLIQGRLKGKWLVNFDVDLQTFYNKVLEKELNSADSINALRVKKALREVVSAYKKETVDSLSSSILFDSVEKRYAYVLKHCPCFTSTVARHFLSLMQSNPRLLNDAFRLRQLNLCCLGGGPATDAVAFAKIVNALNNCFVNGHRGELLLNVFVVDLSEDWDATAKKVMQTLQDTPEFCNRKRMKVKFRFLQADLTSKWTESVGSVLAAADIISMVYFVSAVNGSKDKGKCHSMLQKIMKALKPGSLLFFLDSSKYLHYASIRSAAGSFKDLRNIYGPHLQEFHTLSMKSIKKFMQFYSPEFNVRMCLTNCFVSCAAWTKITIPIHGTIRNEALNDSLAGQEFFDPFSEKGSNLLHGTLRNETLNDSLTGPEIFDPFSEKGSNSLRKMVEYNTRRQETFRQKIEKHFAPPSKFDFDVEDLGDLKRLDECGEADSWFWGERILYPTKSKRYRIVAMPVGEPLRFVDKRYEKKEVRKIRYKLNRVSRKF